MNVSTITPQSSYAHTARAATVLLIGLVVITLCPVLLVVLFAPPETVSFWRALARWSALTAVVLFVLQMALAARLRFLDRVAGHDIVMQFHRGMGFLAAGLAIAHPILLAVDERDLWMFSLDVGWRISLGKGSLLLMVVSIIPMTLVRRMDYLRRRSIHGIALAVAALLALAHGYVLGSDLWLVPVRVFWWMLLVLFLLIALYRKVFVPRWGRIPSVVSAVTRETHDTWTLTLTSERPLPLRLPGQFLFLTVGSPGRRREEHPFTIASPPDDGATLCVTVKESGDYTRDIGRVAEGTRASIEAPFGRFSYPLHDPAGFVFIAGGVGITPIMSMLRHLRETGDQRPGVLLYGNKTEADIIFREELERIPSNVRVVHILSNPTPGWVGPRGYITEEAIREHAGELLRDADAYLCGPPVMTDKVVTALRRLGVPWRRIHYERFSL